MNPSKRYNRATLDDLMQKEFKGTCIPHIIGDEVLEAAKAHNFARKLLFNSVYGIAGKPSKKKSKKKSKIPFNPSRRET